MAEPNFENEPQDRLMKLLLQSALAAMAGWIVAAIAIALPMPATISRVVDHLLLSPTFLLPISAGIVLAVFLSSRGKRISYLAFVPVLALPLSGYIELSRSPLRQHSPWVDLFGIGCGETECLYELIFVVPFISALGYSLTSLILRNRALKRTTGDVNLG